MRLLALYSEELFNVDVMEVEQHCIEKDDNNCYDDQT